MKIEKSDRIISNADYEKLMDTKIYVETELVSIYTHIGVAQDSLLAIYRQMDSLWDLVDKKNEIIQEKNAEIARLKQPWWKRVF